jgi:hypothetical protein
MSHGVSDGLEEGIDLGRTPLGDQLDPAIRKIPYEAGHIESPGQSMRGEAEPHPLHPARVVDAATFSLHDFARPRRPPPDPNLRGGPAPNIAPVILAAPDGPRQVVMSAGTWESAGQRTTGRPSMGRPVIAIR